MIAMFSYIITYMISKRLAVGYLEAKDESLLQTGSFMLIFLLLMFMIFVYTGLNRGLHVKIYAHDMRICYVMGISTPRYS